MAFLAKLANVGLSKQFLWRHIVITYLQNVKYSDAIEDFTSELVNKRKLKWAPSQVANSAQVPKQEILLIKKTTKQLLKEINSIYDSVLNVDLRKLPDKHINNLFLSAIAEKNHQDVNFLANECMKWSRSPSRSVCLEILGFFEELKQHENLEKFYDFCIAFDDCPFLLQLFRVKYLWSEGNTDKALKLLDEIHDVARHALDQKDDLIACKGLFLTLIDDAVGTKSEAVLLKLIHLIETLEDVALLEQVWNKLFTSQWFSDQQLALNLFRRHSSLRIQLSMQTNYITFLLLKDHNVDAVYRLVELLLSHDMMHECQKVLGLLFDYQCECLSFHHSE